MSRPLAYQMVVARIALTPELEPYRDAILAAWPEGDAHFGWAATCDLAELLSWAADVQRNAADELRAANLQRALTNEADDDPRRADDEEAGGQLGGAAGHRG